jgi:cytosine deaminase
MISETDRLFLRKAFEEAMDGLREGGAPIGAVLVEGGQIIARGRNRSNQTGDLTAHAELDCLRNAGALAARPGLTLYTTMSPCIMCAGAMIRLGIARAVVGDATSFPGNPEFLREHGIEVVIVDDPDCLALAQRYAESRGAD